VSLLMIQMSENLQIAPLFDDLLAAHGSENYLKPADQYVKLGRTCQCLHGYRGRSAPGREFQRQISVDGERVTEVVVNPRTSDGFTFSKVIALS
jgi:hypothetical protein